jgi:predicted GNAT family acetyltransferase
VFEVSTLVDYPCKGVYVHYLGTANTYFVGEKHYVVVTAEDELRQQIEVLEEEVSKVQNSLTEKKLELEGKKKELEEFNNVKESDIVAGAKFSTERAGYEDVHIVIDSHCFHPTYRLGGYHGNPLNLFSDTFKTASEIVDFLNKREFKKVAA